VHATDANRGAVEIEVDTPEGLWKGAGGFALVLLIRRFAPSKFDGRKMGSREKTRDIEIVIERLPKD
jgi:hypothetical protein